MSLDPRARVGDLAADVPARTRVLASFGIDFCCGGGRSLEEACRASGQDTDAVLAALAAADRAAAADPAPATDWRRASLADLTAHLVATHHATLRRELPGLAALVAQVRAAHGARHPELEELEGVFGALRAELEAHLEKEEQVLFPFIVALERGGDGPLACAASVRQPIGVMEHEHERAGAALTRLRELSDGYRTPDDGCASYRALMDGLAALETDLHEHIHKENNILHPRAVRLEARGAGREVRHG